MSLALEQDTSWQRSAGSAPVTKVYENAEGAKAMLTFRNKTIYGSVELSEDKGDYRLETVERTDEEEEEEEEEYNVVWAQLDYGDWEDESEVEDGLEPDQPEVDQERADWLVARGEADTDTVVEYSVTVWVTSQFLHSTRDPTAFIEQLVAETNQGYINSGVPLRARLHCIQESSVPDGLPPAVTLRMFTTSQANLNKVRNSADAAILLVENFGEGTKNCGVNWFNAWTRGQTIGTVRKTCAQGYFSFGHEIAHGFGLSHNRRRGAPVSPNNFGYGHIIKPGAVRSIMAYNRAGERRINYYSSPRVMFAGQPTGTADSDNARALTRLRFAVSSVGDETEQCPGLASPSRDRSGCGDKFRSCAWLATSCCWDPLVSAGCPLTCGLCPGLEPSLSLSCYDKLASCPGLANMGGCAQTQVRRDCRAACGLCQGQEH